MAIATFLRKRPKNAMFLPWKDKSTLYMGYILWKLHQIWGNQVDTPLSPVTHLWQLAGVLIKKNGTRASNGGFIKKI
ncbi:hypothetical protein AGMMS49928_24330 [Spirochaetia bacterium]|nr:hypothetical protein AGMMS49928_24330 [Spirochaetia bacterium]